MKFTRTSAIFLNIPNVEQAIFPGFARNADGNLTLLCVGGSGFESSDQRMYVFQSGPDGKNWEYKGLMCEDSVWDFEQPFTNCCKPTLLPDGSMLAISYGYLRDRPDMGLSDYAETFGHFPKIYNSVQFSQDGGLTWNAPSYIKHDYFGLEISGPALLCKDGTLLAVGGPFELNSDRHFAVVLASTDNGRTWTERAKFFDNPCVAPWEMRMTQLPDGRIAVVIWAFDLKEQKHLNTRIFLSDDNGFTWTDAIDTGLRAQASNWLVCGDKVAILQARREGAAAGIYLNFVEIGEDSVKTGEDICLWLAANGANAAGNIETQFANLKFGQPSAMMLDDHHALLCHWFFDGSNYSVVLKHFDVE